MDFGHRYTGVGMEMLMDLSVYTLRSLQETAGLLTAMAMDGIDTGQALPAIAQEVNGRVGEAIDRDKSSQIIRCPSCGRRPMVPVRNPDGLRVMGCIICRYSEIV